MGHVLQRDGWTGWTVGTLQEDALCLAGLVLKHRLNLMLPPSGHSFKTKAAFGAEYADAISLPTASGLRINNTALTPPKSWAYTDSALPMPPGTCCQSEPEYHSSTTDGQPSYVLIFTPH